MRIEPVFLVAPRPEPTRVPTRRAFLFAGGAFAFGSVIGGACGYSIGAAKGAVVDASGEVELETSGDARLDALRRLAVKAPIEDLVKNWNEWWADFWFDYDSDPILWRGVDRLATWTAANLSAADTQLLSALVMACQGEKRGPETTLMSHGAAIQTERSTRLKKR